MKKPNRMKAEGQWITVKGHPVFIGKKGVPSRIDRKLRGILQEKYGSQLKDLVEISGRIHKTDEHTFGGVRHLTVDDLLDDLASTDETKTITLHMGDRRYKRFKPTSLVREGDHWEQGISSSDPVPGWSMTGTDVYGNDPRTELMSHKEFMGKLGESLALAKRRKDEKISSAQREKERVQENVKIRERAERTLTEHGFSSGEVTRVRKTRLKIEQLEKKESLTEKQQENLDTHKEDLAELYDEKGLGEKHRSDMEYLTYLSPEELESGKEWNDE